MNSLDYYSLILNNSPSAPDQIRNTMEKEKKLNKLLKELEKAQIKLEGLQANMGRLIQEVSDVEGVAVFWQAGDGFVIADSNSNNSPLDKCLLVITNKGRLTYEDYKNLNI